MRSILNYPGAKWGLAQRIVALMPPHHSYLEPFFGSGAVLFSKPPCIVEKPDACLVVASYSADRAVTIGRYADRKEADSAFRSLLNNLVGNSSTYAFTMPDSVLYHGEKWERVARTTRKD